MADFDRTLDASGLNCPLPILRARKTLAELNTGQVLRIITTDSCSAKDFEAFAEQTGNLLVDSRQDGEKYYFFIKKGR